MDEILASIRRMISDDDTRGLTRKAKASTLRNGRSGNVARLFERSAKPEEIPVEQTVEAAIEEVLAELNAEAAVSEASAEAAAAELKAELAVAEAIAPEPNAEAAVSEAAVEESDVAAEPVAMIQPEEMPPVAEEPAPVEVEEPQRATFPRAERSAAERPNPLMSPRSDAAVASAFNQLASTMFSGNARTIDEFVEDMIRPMLKGWLDNNLPPLVERLVREEIERVSRGRR